MVPHWDASTLMDQDLDSIRNYLVFFGIRNRQQLERFVRATEIFDFLAEVYKDELKRSPDNPLDPTGISVWGAILFTRGNQEEVRNEIIKRIKASTEFKERHPVST
jgi:hypothetical protein